MPRHGPLALLLTSSAHGVVVVDGHGAIQYVNPAATTMFGYQADELIGAPVHILLPARLAAQHRDEVTNYLLDPVARSMGTGRNLLARHRTGTQFPVEISLTPLPGPKGEIQVLASVVDITARVRTEQIGAAHNRSYRTLSLINQALARAEDVTDVYRAICRITVETGGYLGAWVGVPTPTGAVEVTAVAGSIENVIDELDIMTVPTSPRARGPTAAALRDGVTTWIPDLASDPRIVSVRSIGHKYGIRAAMTAPLSCDGEVVASFSVYTGESTDPGEGMRELVERVAANASLALDGLAERQRLQQLNRQRTRLMAHLLTAQEAERTRIAGDIHDEPVQGLAAAELRLELLSSRLHGLPEAAPLLTQIRTALRDVAEELRRLLTELEPAHLGNGLPSAIREAAGQLLDGTAVTWQLHEVTPLGLSGAQQTQALRIVSDVLVNVRRRNSAHQVAVTLAGEADGAEITLDIEEPDPRPEGAPPEAPGGTMRERAELAGGRWRVESRPGVYRLRFWLPNDPTPAPEFAPPGRAGDARGQEP